MARILIIDDDSRFRKCLRMMLELGGHEVTEAADGLKGIKEYGRNPVDVVFCDIFMPEMEGLETIRQLRRQYPQAKIVSMSGGCPYAAPQDYLPMARKFGAVKVLPKPFDLAKVLQVVREVTGGAEAGQAPSPG